MSALGPRARRRPERAGRGARIGGRILAVLALALAIALTLAIARHMA